MSNINVINPGADITTHAADLAAHTLNIGQIFRTGEYLPAGFLLGYTTSAIQADRIIARYLWVARNITVDRIAVYVATAGAAGTVIRLGIYNNGTNLLPGSLLLDAGTVAVDSTGVKAITINQALTKGLYWLALFSDGAPTLGAHASAWSPIGMDNSIQNTKAHWYKDTAYGTLPDPFPADASTFSFMYSIFVRVASLD